MGKNVEDKKRQLPPSEAQSLLKEEIVQLQKELEAQSAVRFALEKAINSQPLMDDPTYKSLSQPAENLVKEIALLELEVVYLEKYLLTLYRKNLVKKLSTLPEVNGCPNAETRNRISCDGTNVESTSKSCSFVSSRNDGFVARVDSAETLMGSEALVDTGIFRCHSSLSQHSACSFRMSPPFEAVAEAADSFYSLPLSMLERKQDFIPDDDFGEYETSFGDRARETPNSVSEEMIKCISTIYTHLSDPPLFNHSLNSDPKSSPQFESSPLGQHDLYVRSCEEDKPFNTLMNSPSSTAAAARECNGSFISTMFEVRGILRDSERLSKIENLLQDFRSLISRLAQVDPGKLKHEEKLAFWINVHNALVMHAFLVYGIPRGNLKRISLVLKAAYNVGGHTISVDRIQCSILGCRQPRPSQWLHSLFFPKTKFKAGDPRKAYAIKNPEPRLHFALCSGFKSDPAVRVYTPKKIFQELEMAKEEYIEMNTKLHKEQRLVTPKNVEYFIKETGLSPSGVAEMIEHSISDALRKKFQQPQLGKLLKKVVWIPHDFSFGFLISNELVMLR